MRRLALFLPLAIAVVVTPFAVEAQQAGKVARIGFRSQGSPSTSPEIREAFRQQLRELGYVEGQNIVIEYRWAEGRAERLPDLAAELVSLKGRRHCIWGYARAACCEACHHYDPDRLGDGWRPGRHWSCAEPRQTGGKCHRAEQSWCGAQWETVAAL